MNQTAKSNELTKSFSSKGIFPHQWAFTLLIPLRNIILSPTKLIKRMGLTPEMQVLEVGSGPGYFSLPIAKFLSKGNLTVADIQPEMLEMAKKRLTKGGCSNVSFYNCNGTNFDLPSESFDRIFLVTVLGEIENQENYIAEFYRLLKPNGILTISEQAGDPDKLSFIETQTLVEKFGFTYFQIFGTVRNYTINFTKRNKKFNGYNQN
jgi:ubiquinone/menaquinone biosynthesis C-methylase UbiE